MCLRLIYYPLVKLDDGKQRLMLNYGIKLENRESLEDIKDMSKYWKMAPYSPYESINRLKRKEGIDNFVKMVSIPCGCCRECMNMISREWAYRIVLEASDYPDNSYFVTLTYDDDHLPSDHMLQKDLISKFNKKLKTYLKRKGLNSDFRFYGVGEYGSLGVRPHYHIIYFNLDIPDLKYVYTDENGYPIYESKFLESVWSNGFVVVGSVTIGSASYVARYCEKKKRLNKSEKQALIDKGIVPEYSVMSRRPGIGANSYDKHYLDFVNGIFNHYVNGKSYSIPLYWLKKIKESLAGTVDLDSNEFIAPHPPGVQGTAPGRVARNNVLPDQGGSLELYQMYANIKSASKVESLLRISDKTNLTNYLKNNDNIKTKRKL